MQENLNAPPLNPLPLVVWLLTLPIIAMEVVLSLGAGGVVGGPQAIGWRLEAIQRFAFSPDFMRQMYQDGRYPLDGLARLVTYPFVHGNFTHAMFVVVMLLAFKLAIPDGLYMTRGNHETKGMNKIYGFEGEVKHKYDAVVMQLFSEVFQSLPLAAVIANKVFVVHGGISTINDGCVTLKEIDDLYRFREPPESGLMSDLLWSGILLNHP